MLKNLMETVKGRKRLPARDRFPMAAHWPSLDLDEDDKEVRVKVEAPGLSDKDLRVTYADGMLSIEGEKREEREEDRKGVHYRESRYGSFMRSVPIEAAVDWDRAKARYKRGVLEVAIPKKAGAGAGRKLIRVD
jgi:HSP20 family protein